MQNEPKKLPGDEVPPGTEQSGEAPCRACKGTGRVEGRRCVACAGTGKTTVLVGDA
jgi:DnaJ-class molecular chaperone